MEYFDMTHTSDEIKKLQARLMLLENIVTDLKNALNDNASASLDMYLGQISNNWTRHEAKIEATYGPLENGYEE
jgi:hypothetical protein